MAAAKPVVTFFKDIQKEDIALVGGKGANLGEMTGAGFPVPPGFAVTVAAYDLFLAENHLLEEVTKILKDTDVNDSAQLSTASRVIQKKVLAGKVPELVFNEVTRAYKKLSGPFRKVLVAVRSSATAEDLPSASFAGQQESFLNVLGEANLMDKIRECWASLFTARAIFYRVENKIPHEKVKLSAIVQKMIASEVSGVMFTLDPVTNEKDRIIVEAVWGLGEMIVQGSVVPDHYVVQKETFSILSKEVSDQVVMLVREGERGNKEVEVPKNIRAKQKLPDKFVTEIAKIGQKIQEHYYFPQDIEWSFEKNKLYIIQARPVTTMKIEARGLKTEAGEIKTAAAPLFSGLGASPGMATGPVKVLQSAKEIDRIKKGDVLVAPMTSPDFVPAMKIAAAIITDEGGPTSHAAIVSRELGIPCVVGTGIATKKLKDGYIVTVDGKNGQVYLGGKVKFESGSHEVEKKYDQNLKTATKVYVNLAEPELAEKVSKANVDGVGLLRAEFMIANIGIHPREAIKEKKQEHFIDKLAADMEKFCKAFEGRPVVYRATDFKTNEYRALPGGKNWEPEEPNPLLGFRGAFRYVANPEVFNLELSAMKKVREKYKNLWLMIPFVRSPEELKKVRRIVATEGLFESPTFKFWMMVEIPTNVILLEDFIKVGIDGVSVGSNDLTMLITGTDRDNSEVASDFNEMSPAILWSLRRVIRLCHKHGVTASICGQAVSTYDELVYKLVRYGVTSVSVNPDAVDRVREVVSQAERMVANG